MSFDRLAAHYHWLENLFAGGLMQRCRTTYLSRIKNCRNALLVGEGTGRFLVALLRENPDLRITCVEQSAGMVRQARRRLACESMDAARVDFHEIDVLRWDPPAGKYDLIVTHFFLDCFPAGPLRQLILRLAESAGRDAVWLLADFRLPERGWRRWRACALLAGLYLFFKLTTSLPANWLTPPDAILKEAGFRLCERRLYNFDFAHADLWRREG